MTDPQIERRKRISFGRMKVSKGAAGWLPAIVPGPSESAYDRSELRFDPDSMLANAVSASFRTRFSGCFINTVPAG